MMWIAQERKALTIVVHAEITRLTFDETDVLFTKEFYTKVVCGIYYNP